MADFDNMRRLIDAMEAAEAGESTHLIKVNEDITMLREAGEEVAQRICQGSLDGKLIGGYVFNQVEFRDNEDGDGWDCAYEMQIEDSTGQTEIETNRSPDPQLDNSYNVEYTASMVVYAVFGDNYEGGYTWIASIDDFYVDVEGHTIKGRFDLPDDIEGNGEKPLESLKSLIANLDGVIDNVINEVEIEVDGPDEPDDFDDRRHGW